LRFLWKQRWDVYRRIAWMSAAATAGAAVLTLLAFLPVRNSIREPLVVLTQTDEPIFVRTPGFIETVEHDTGDYVRTGDVIVRLSDPTLKNILDQAVSRREQEEIKAADAAAANKPALLASSQEAIAAYDKQISLIKQRMEDLVLRSPV